MTDEKNVTAWYALRNSAAHGDYGKYTQEQVRLVVAQVQEFVQRVGA